jgi:exodeoxyribonuclease VII small subunit
MAKKKQFESYLDNSKIILDKLMEPDIALDESLKLYKDGIAELKAAQDILEKTKLEYETLKINN